MLYKKYQVINLNKLKAKRIGSGAYGTYFRVSRLRGIKIMSSSSVGDITQFDRCDLRMAHQEARALRKAYKSGLTPKLYKVCIAKYHKRYYAAVVMQHMEGYKEAKHFLDTSCEYDKMLLRNAYTFHKSLNIKHNIKSFDLFIHLNKIIKKKSKAEHLDLHYSNVLFKANKKGVITSIKVVDLASLDW